MSVLANCTISSNSDLEIFSRSKVLFGSRWFEAKARVEYGCESLFYTNSYPRIVRKKVKVDGTPNSRLWPYWCYRISLFI